MRIGNPTNRILLSHIVHYPTPVNLKYSWGFGSLAGLCLAIQIVTGVILAMHYSPHIDLAFNSVEHIMRDVNYGWLMRYTHANGASMFFIVLYLHIGRGLYYKSYVAPRELVWYSGIILYILVMAIAFMGYVLPWGQMSFWGATVITNLFSAVPLVGPYIAKWLWGGYSVANATLVRFFALHFCLPFVLAALSLLHIIFLHSTGSNNPIGVKSSDNIAFFPYFISKDLLGLFFFIIFFGYLVFFEPNLLGHPDNYIRANPLSTPTHIVPEWYFLPWYAILRAIPDKLGGVIAMGGGIAILAILPRLDRNSSVRSSLFRPLFTLIFFFFIFCFLCLGWLGGQPIEAPFVFFSRFFGLFYFSYFIILLPLLNSLEIWTLNWKPELD